MVQGKRRGGKRVAKRGMKRRAPRRRIAGRNGVPERASCTEIFPLGLATTNKLYTAYTTALSNFPRAQLVAKAYQFYRIKRITWTFKPLADTYTAGGGTSIPHLYYMVDRTKQFFNATIVDVLKKAGAVPHRLDDKIVRFSITPSVLQATLDNTSAPVNTFVQYKMSPWLPCRDITNPLGWVPNSTDHLGAVYIVENMGGNETQYWVEKQVEFEFKKASYDFNLGEGEPLPDEETVIQLPAKV